MKRILINATQNEEIRVALCKGNHLYDFDLENRTREQKKSNIYKGHVTRVEPSLEAVFVEYGSQRQGFLPIREISAEYLSGNPRDENIKKLIKEGDELIVQVEKEERGNKGAALSTYVSLAGRYLVLMPNNPRGGGISRQISGKLREDMKRMLGSLDLPKGMSVIIRTAGIGKTQEDLQHDLNHLLNIWQAIQEQNQKYPSPRLVHQEAGVVTRAVRDYLRDDITEIWIDNENAYIEAAGFIDAVMPKQAEKLRKYTDYEPMFSRFNIEKQIETAYQREVRLPSGGSIVIDQTEALVSIDINSAKSTKGADVSETAYHTNLEAADEIARQLRLRDMGGLIVIDFIDMNDNKNQKEVEKRLIDATKYDRARVQFGEISKFGLMEMSRQRLRPSLEESTGYICPRCHGNGMIRDLRSLSLSIMRQIEQIALKERQGEVQAEVPTDIAAFLLNEKRDALVYLEQDSGTRITILPHAHLESPNFKLHFNRDGFAPSSYERITDTAQEHSDLGYNVDWQTAEKERPEQQPTRQPRSASDNTDSKQQTNTVSHSNDRRNNKDANSTASARPQHNANTVTPAAPAVPLAAPTPSVETSVQPQAVAWLSNLFAQAPQAKTTDQVSSRDAAEAIEALVNTGAQSLGSVGQVDSNALAQTQGSTTSQPSGTQSSTTTRNEQQQSRRSDSDDENQDNKGDDRRRRKTRKTRTSKPHQRKDQREDSQSDSSSPIATPDEKSSDSQAQDAADNDNKRNNDRNRNRQNSSSDRNTSTTSSSSHTNERQDNDTSEEQTRAKRKPHSQRRSRGNLERGETLTAEDSAKQNNARRSQDPNEVTLQVNQAPAQLKSQEVVHLSLDDSKSAPPAHPSAEKRDTANERAKDAETVHTTSDDNNSQTQDSNRKSVSAPSTDTVQADDRKADNEKASASTANDNATPQAKTSEHAKVSDEQHISQEKPSSAKSTADNAKPLKNAVEATVKAESEVSEPLASPQKAEQISEAKPNETLNKEEAPDKDEASNKDETLDSSDSHSAAFAIDHKAMFAARYVTADKFGQASNDPRVVRRQQASPKTAPVATAEPVAAKTAIRGSVGEFIHATLAEAKSRLAEDGVINCFIAAIAQHQEQSTANINDASNSETQSGGNDHSEATTDESNTSSFDFSNYGYAPLSKDYLADFSAMTQAVSQFGATQGKTEVTPTAIGKRASNDPRGPHADYQEPAVLTTPDEPEQSVSDVEAHELDATAIVSEAQTDAVSADSEHLLTADQAQHSATEPAAEVAISENATAVNTIAEESDIAQSEVVEQADDSIVEEPTKEEIQAAKSKTTIASYKNMIENVAEQLLPQKGMFNLTTPKVPKARARKPKTEHKKPTQAEKSESDDSDSES